MYTFYPHIASLYSSASFAWLLFSLLTCAVMTLISYPTFLNECVSVLFSKITRRYSDTTRLTPIVFSHLFLVGSFALCLWLCMYSAGGLHWLQFVLFAALIALWLLARFLVSRFIGYVFSIQHEAQAIQEDSLSLLMLVSLLFYVPCCLTPLLPLQPILPQLAAGIIVLYIIALTGKMTVSYARSVKSLFYIALYIMTLEIIPMAFLYGMAARISLIV